MNDKIRAQYDPINHMLYVALPGHPETKGCVKYTRQDTPGVLHDIGHDDKVIGFEFMLDEALYIYPRCECSNPELYTYRADPDWWTCNACDRRVRPKTPDELAGNYGN